MLKPGCTVFYRQAGDSKIFIKPVSSYVDPRAVNTAPMCIVSPQCNRKSPRLALWTAVIKSKVRKKRPSCGHMERRAATENSREECQGPQTTIKNSVKHSIGNSRAKWSPQASFSTVQNKHEPRKNASHAYQEGAAERWMIQQRMIVAALFWEPEWNAKQREAGEPEKAPKISESKIGCQTSRKPWYGRTVEKGVKHSREH